MPSFFEHFIYPQLLSIENSRLPQFLLLLFYFYYYSLCPYSYQTHAAIIIDMRGGKLIVDITLMIDQ